MPFRFRGLASIAVLAAAMAGPASAQSQNVPLIVDRLMDGVCAPYVRSGDIAAAVRAAEALGYRQVEGRSHLLLDRTLPSGQVLLVRSQGGGVMLGLSYQMGHCVIGVNEGGVEAVADAAEPHLGALGLTRILDETGREPSHMDMVVWMSAEPGAEVQASVIRGLHFSPGSELTLTFSVDPAGR